MLHSACFPMKRWESGPGNEAAISILKHSVILYIAIADLKPKHQEAITGLPESRLTYRSSG